MTLPDDKIVHSKSKYCKVNLQEILGFISDLMK